VITLNPDPGLVLKKKTVDILDTPDEPLDLRVHFEAGTLNNP